MTTEKKLSQLKLTKNNPRTFTTKQSDDMDAQLQEFGPLDGIVYNVNPGVDELVGGNRRTTKFTQAYDPQITIDTRYDTPTRTGTVAEGWVRVDGERWSYREVDWPMNKHKAGVIIANNAGGDNDFDALAEYAIDIDVPYLEILSVDLDSLQPSPLDDLEDKEPTPKDRKYSLDELRTLAKGIYPAQADVILDFLEAVQRASA